MNLRNTVSRLALVFGVVGVGNVALTACGYTPRAQPDAATAADSGAVTDTGSPVDTGTVADNGPPPADNPPPTDTGPADTGPADTGPADSGVVVDAATPSDSGPPFRCTPGMETDWRDCVNRGVPGTTHSVCNAAGNDDFCTFRPGCTFAGCTMSVSPVCPVAGAETNPADCQPGAAPGTTHSVCSADRSMIVCALRPGCSPIGCMTGMPDAGVPSPDAGAPTTDAGVTPGAYVTYDITCDGRTLTGVPAACVGMPTGSTCYHVCNITPVYLADSRHPNADQVATSMRLVQTQDPTLRDAMGNVRIDIGNFVAPTLPAGVTRWEGSAFVPIRSAPGAYPFFNAENNYARAIAGPFAYLWAVGQDFLGMGLETNGVLRIWRVNADLTQTAMPWQIVANPPTMEGTANAFMNGGDAHPLGTGCPPYLVRPAGSLYNCTP